MSLKDSEENALIEVISRRNDPILRRHKELQKEVQGPPKKKRGNQFVNERPCVVCQKPTHYAVSSGHLKYEAVCSQVCHEKFERDRTRDELTPHNQYHSYLSGWRTAAGIKVIPKDIAEHRNPLIREEWQTGYNAGIMARNASRRVASNRSGYWPDNLTLQDSDE